jgi:hypothetical protein
MRIPSKLKKHIQRHNKMEMKAQIVADVVLIFVTHAPSLLHHNIIRVTYAGTYNFKMESIRYISLYFVAMF